MNGVAGIISYNVQFEAQTGADDLDNAMHECVREHGVDEFRERSRAWSAIAWVQLTVLQRPLERSLVADLVLV